MTETVTTTNKTAINIANSHKMLSVWWMGIVSTFAGCWLTMPASMQEMILSKIPMPAWAIPIVSFGIGYYLRVKAQKNIPGPVAEAKSADAPQEPVEVPKIVAEVVGDSTAETGKGEQQ